MDSTTANPWQSPFPDQDLPVLSTVAAKAIALLQSEEPSARELEAIISLDPALATRILRLANSPVFGGQVKATSIGQALVRLGMDTVRQTILSAAMAETVDRSDPQAQTLWEHAVAVGFLAQWLSERLQIGRPGDLFLCGLLHDVGKLVIYRRLPEAYGRLIQEAQRLGVRFYQHERTTIKWYAHDTLGAAVAAKWHMNEMTIEAIRLHHDIEQETEATQVLPPELALVSAANLLANYLGFGNEASAVIDLFDSRPVRLIGLKPETTEEASQAMAAVWDEQLAAFS